ncbi:MAG: DUF2520 domain-containing protein [Deltaproteobacteria bacterium]|nr:DUF2520 domain-containing protein [Deltaproteobacteria bacterium]
MSARLPRTAAILGGGAVGSVLLPALRTAGVRIVATWNRTPKPPLWRSGPFPRAIREAEVVFLAVSDAAVSDLCRDLAATKVVGAGQLVVHLAGALDLDVLGFALHNGARIGSLHPLRAIPAGSRADALIGATAGVAGSDDDALGSLSLLAEALQMHPLRTAGDRALYHASAVLAAGGQIALFAEATRAFSHATGATLAESRAALLPLTKGALAQLEAHQPSEIITGPVVRGDVGTVRAHLAALERFGVDLSALYWLLSSAAVRLAGDGGRTSPEALVAIVEALKDAGASLIPGGPRGSSAQRPAAQGHAHADPHDHGHAHSHDHAHARPSAKGKPKLVSVQAAPAKGKPAKPARPAKAKAKPRR